MPDPGQNDSLLAGDGQGGGNDQDQGNGQPQGNGGSRDPWYSGYKGEEFESEEGQSTLQKYSSAEDALKGLIGAQKVLGRKGIVPPGEDATDEERAAFSDEVAGLLGRPEEADGYEWDAPEGIGIDEERFSEARQKLHDARLTPEQFDTVMGLYAEEILQFGANIEADRQATVDNLKGDWGDDYQERLAASRGIFEKLGLSETIVASGLGDSEAMIRVGDELSRSLSEDSLEGRTGGSRTPNIEQEIERVNKAIQNTPRRDPEYPALVKRKDRLYQEKYG